jgi:hypothetical protein
VALQIVNACYVGPKQQVAFAGTAERDTRECKVYTVLDLGPEISKPESQAKVMMPMTEVEAHHRKHITSNSKGRSASDADLHNGRPLLHNDCITTA